MASWQTLSRDSFRAAKLTANKYSRSSLSRSYYAAFSAATAMLQSQSDHFPKGWQSPRHNDVIKLLDQFANPAIRSELKSNVSVLYKYRLRADYDASSQFEPEDADLAVKIAGRTMRLLGVI